ncbi:NifU family protein [Streptomyces sp. AK02-01A]|uniref:NifU family protein n=1 Tax=Streptomyces sp. AK02-01A TaxID=3028648 RepID=UPI0029AA8075|nr:NifU family protein [Streptomyces sp. AK02-01A]MDX3850113.1 NifU family protein [Streptomyces sp. AK02-01A]
MAATAKEQQAGERITALLDELGRSTGPAGRDLADELVRSIVEFYGTGLARVVELLDGAPDGTDPLELLGADELVGGLLVLHDLHPEDTMTRVGRALDEVRPYLGSHAGDVDVAGIVPDEEADGAGGQILRLRLRGSCDGCPSSAQTVRWTIEEAVARRAPEISRVEVEGVAEEKPGPKLLQIMSRPPDDATGARPAGPAEDAPAEWHPLPAFSSLADGESTVCEVAGTPLVLVRLPGDLYAYRDHCPACAGRLGAAAVDGGRLRCPSCAAEYDIRGAGQGDRGRLGPVPLLEENGSVRVALPGVLLAARP